MFQKKLDKLPKGPGWTCEIVTSTGDRVGLDGKLMTEKHELWRRDPVECVQELIGNPAFKEYISYVPEPVYADPEGKTRTYDEMWTGDWWWTMQVSILSHAEQRRLLIFSHCNRNVSPKELLSHLSSLHQTRRLSHVFVAIRARGQFTCLLGISRKTFVVNPQNMQPF
jgi:hypothetical protein